MYEQRNNRYKERKEYVDNLNVNVDRDVQILFNRLYKMYDINIYIYIYY